MTVVDPKQLSTIDGYIAPTDEERARDRERIAAELRQLKDSGIPLDLPRKRETGDLSELLKGVTARAEEAEAARKLLPCWPGVDAGDDDRAVADCESARAFEGCKWAVADAVCPRKRALELFDTVKANLDAPPASLRVPAREAALILAAVAPRYREPLWTLDALKVVRGVLTRKRCKVDLEDGAEVNSDGQLAPGAVHLTGAETLFGLGGNQGRQKTVAACYAVARLGGIYTRAPMWTRRGAVDVDDAIKAPVLVIDQFGREHFGDSAWALSQFEDAIDARLAARRMTFLVGNITYERFCDRLRDTTIVDKLRDDGVFVEFAGESIRAGLRAARLKEGT